MHSHLLPGIDDGAKSLDETVFMIEKMYNDGIKNFITTPHVMGGVWENSSQVIKEKEKLVLSALKQKGFTDVKLHACAEYMLDEHFEILLEKGDILTLNKNYILIEMSFFCPPINLEKILTKIKDKGYIPVLAHPERYAFYHQNISIYKKLLDVGCLFQLNLLSLTGHYGKQVTKIANRLLSEGWYHFTGSDAHHKHHLHLLDTIATAKNQKKLDSLFRNNVKIFSNEKESAIS